MTLKELIQDKRSDRVMNRDRGYLSDIYQCILRIEKYTCEGEKAFMESNLIHDYIRVDLSEVWGVVETYLPNLKAQIKLILQDI